MRPAIWFFVGMVLFGVPVAAQPRPPHTPAPAKPTPIKTAPATDAGLNDEAELTRVVSLYEAGKYRECAAELGSLLTAGSTRHLRDREIVETARIYHAACLIGAGKPEQADEPLKAAIRANVQMRPPDSLLFPPPVIERFLRVRQGLYDEIKRVEARRVQEAREAAEARAAREREEARRVSELERLASREVLVVRNRRFVAWLPFGAGQFQNGQDGLGWVFLTSELVLSATALTSIGFQTYLEKEAATLENPDNNAVLRTWNTLLNVSSYAFLGVAAIGVLQAQLAFVPEVREERSKPLPARLRRQASQPRWSPDLGVQSNGFSFGVRGRF